MREKIITGTRDDGEKTGPMAKARRWAGGHKTMLVCIGVGALTAFAAIASCRTGHAGGVKTGSRHQGHRPGWQRVRRHPHHRPQVRCERDSFRGGLGRIRIPSGKEHRRRAPVSAGFGGSEGMPLGCRQLQTRNARILSGSWLHRRRSGETSAPSGFRAGFPGFGLFVLVRASASSLSRKSISSPTLIEPSGR